MLSCRNIQTFLLVVLLMISFTTAEGQEFAIHNKVLGHEDMANETRTIITEDAYYDVILSDGKPVKVSVYYLSQRRFQLVSFSEKTQTSIGEEEVLRFVANLGLRANRLGPLVGFAADPKFQETRVEDVIRLESSVWDYSVVLDDTRKPEVVLAYQRFADAFARLNAFWSLPPNARLKLNEAIHKHGGIPKRVDVHIKKTAGNPEIEQHTDHFYTWQLTTEDVAIVDSTKKAIKDFQTIEFRDFLNSTLATDRRARQRN